MRALAGLPSSRLQETIRRVVRQQRELKSAQQSSGASGQLGYDVSSPQTWDLKGSLPSASNGFVEFTMTFTSDTDWPIVIPATDLRFNSPEISGHIYVRGSSGYGWAGGGDTINMSSIDRMVPSTLSDARVLKFVMSFYYSGSPSYYVKARGQSSSSGTWSVARTA